MPCAARSITSSSRPSSRIARIAAAKAPTPGTTSPSARAQRVVVGGQRDAGADALERLLDAAAVAHAVVDNPIVVTT